MKTLAIEFASERRSVAVLREGVVTGRAEESGGRHARAFALIERALAEAGMVREEIEHIAVGLGPGSYAGIRSAIALAQGWQLGRAISVSGVGTVECLAAQAAEQGGRGTAAVLIDAQRNEFYSATYVLEGADVAPRCVEPLRIISFEAACTLAAERLLIWPGLQERFSRGDVLLPDAGMVGRLAGIEGASGMRGADLEPVYLRETNFVKAPPARVIPD